jgi:hypothetical protein
VIFKFPASGIRLLRVVVITLFYSVLILVAYERDPKEAWKIIIALLVVVPFLLSACYATFVAGLDLLIDDAGMYRLLDGRKFKRLEWSDIELIRDIVMVGAYGRKRRFFNVLPKPSRKRLIGGAGKIVFSDDMDNFPVFVRVINEKLQLHGIKTQRLQGGELRSIDKISV